MLTQNGTYQCFKEGRNFAVQMVLNGSLNDYELLLIFTILRKKKIMCRN